MNFYLQTESETPKPVESSARPVMDVLLLDRNVAEAADLRAKLADSRYAAFSVTTTSAVAEALQLLEMQRFDVVLVDADTPENRGLATFAELHSVSPNIPIVAVSSEYREAEALELVRAGAQDRSEERRVGKEGSSWW